MLDIITLDSIKHWLVLILSTMKNGYSRTSLAALFLMILFSNCSTTKNTRVNNDLETNIPTIQDSNETSSFDKIDNTTKEAVEEEIVIIETENTHLKSTENKDNTIAAKFSRSTTALIIASFSGRELAEDYIHSFYNDNPQFKGQLGVIDADNRFRVGFLNFLTQKDAMTYKAMLITDYPQFKDAWPYKL